MLAKTLPSSSPSNPGDPPSGNPCLSCRRGAPLGSRSAAGIELNCFPQKQFPEYGAEFPERKMLAGLYCPTRRSAGGVEAVGARSLVSYGDSDRAGKPLKRTV